MFNLKEILFVTLVLFSVIGIPGSIPSIIVNSQVGRISKTNVFLA